jgi:formate hydrogenlyase transcriptional activator
MLLDYNGHTLEEMQGPGTDERHQRDLHPDDLERARSERRCGLASGVPFEIEKRMRGKDGRYRWFLFRYNPLLNEQGRVARFATATDIEDRKQTEQRVRNENLALREQIDRDSMFEDIVGSSEALRKVLRQVGKVAIHKPGSSVGFSSDRPTYPASMRGTNRKATGMYCHTRKKVAERKLMSRSTCLVDTYILVARPIQPKAMM